MTTIAPALCRACGRLDLNTRDELGGVIPTRCTAYPDGIPSDILLDAADHRAPRGDESAGLVFLASGQGQDAFADWVRFARPVS